LESLNSSASGDLRLSCDSFDRRGALVFGVSHNGLEVGSQSIGLCAPGRAGKRSHPKVDDAAVIGVPDPEWGEEPRALVVLKKGLETSSEEIMEHCRSNLAGFKRPRSVVFLESLPRNPMGKVLKKELRAKYGQA
jgi:hypothetical protein